MSASAYKFKHVQRIQNISAQMHLGLPQFHCSGRDQQPRPRVQLHGLTAYFIQSQTFTSTYLDLQLLPNLNGINNILLGKTKTENILQLIHPSQMFLHISIALRDFPCTLHNRLYGFILTLQGFCRHPLFVMKHFLSENMWIVKK